MAAIIRFLTPANQPAYQELYARWFEYGAFCPIFRTHGHRDHNELWTYDQVYPALLAVDRLRYRLLPYVYSLAWKVTSEDYTIQRPLVMDFREDPATWEIGDEFLFGPAILVSPVLKEHARSRSVYLPAGTEWYDFWTGSAPKAAWPLPPRLRSTAFLLPVRAGSILPLGPAIEYAGQATDPIELRVYPGANGDFTLYEDEGDSYRYEQGAHATIPIHWDDATHTLTLAARRGSFYRHAGQPHLQCCDCLRRPWHGRRRNGRVRQNHPLFRQEHRGEVLGYSGSRAYCAPCLDLLGKVVAHPRLILQRLKIGGLPGAAPDFHEEFGGSPAGCVDHSVAAGQQPHVKSASRWRSRRSCVRIPSRGRARRQ